MKAKSRTITNLPVLLSELTKSEKALVEKIFDIRESKGELIYPENPEVVKGYGPKEQVIEQKIIKITNKITYESSLFNELRSRRPFQTKEIIELEEEINKSEGCIFCTPKAYHVTPKETFLENGRIKKETCFTASNPGKYDGYHGLVIFKDHTPFSFQFFPEYLDCSIEWAINVHKKDKDAIYFFFLWNCLWKAGGSIIHGHTQMSLGKGMHYGKIEYLLKAAKNYKENYFDDLYRAHEMLGLGFRIHKVRLIVYLTPIKEKEVLVIADNVNDIKDVVPEILNCFYSKLGVRSFNLALICSPLAVFDDVTIEERSRWNGFPIIVRIVDRGDLANRTTDFGSMELYASSVISSDPFKVAEEISKFMLEK
jgi:hypothetical protein